LEHHNIVIIGSLHLSTKEQNQKRKLYASEKPLNINNFTYQ